MNSELLKAYKHKGINYKLILVTWPGSIIQHEDSLAYLSKMENGIILNRLNTYKGKSWLVLSCFHPNIADEIKKHWQ